MATRQLGEEIHVSLLIRRLAFSSGATNLIRRAYIIRTAAAVCTIRGLIPILLIIQVKTVAWFSRFNIFASVMSLEVPDVVCPEYTLPGYRTSNRLSSKSSDVPPPLLNFLPKPPQAPPPEDFYPGSEISTLPLMTPPLSPHKVTYSKSNRHFLLPISPEPEEFEEDVDVPSFPRERLRIVEKLGEGHFEDVHLCEFANEEGRSLLVVVYTLRLESFRPNFRKDVLGLAKISHENVSLLLGACLESEPICAVREYSDKGDLCQFLQDHVAETATSIVNTASTLR